MTIETSKTNSQFDPMCATSCESFGSCLLNPGTGECMLEYEEFTDQTPNNSKNAGIDKGEKENAKK